MRTVNETSPIGVFDSGVGGLSVLHWIRTLLPNEDLIYVADSLYVPYGEKTKNRIQERALTITEFLVNEGAKAVVVACNTATVAAIPLLRAQFSLPIIGIEPGVKPALSQSKSGIVGVLATTNTINSESFQKLVSRYAAGRQVEIQACPGLVECVEEAALASRSTRELVQTYVMAVLEKGADTIVLGCTHYPFLLPMIKSLVGTDIEVIDTGEAVAREVKRRLDEVDLLNTKHRGGEEVFWASGADTPLVSQKTMTALWGRDLVVKLL
ncbi:MAG: glutamate racemase [Pseudomonadales bacterium]|nr:glutamate racemase [Pseudomonadales bacterium]